MGKAVLVAAFLHGSLISSVLISDIPFSGTQNTPQEAPIRIIETVWEEPEPVPEPQAIVEPETKIESIPVEKTIPAHNVPAEVQVFKQKPVARIQNASPPVKPQISPVVVQLKTPVVNKIAQVQAPIIKGVKQKIVQKPVKATYPAYLNNPKPPYPKMSRKRKQEGVVHLDVLVGPEGQVKDISLHKSCGHRKLDESALQTVRHWQFLPAKHNGVRVESRVIVPIRFSLKSAN